MSRRRARSTEPNETTDRKVFHDVRMSGWDCFGCQGTREVGGQRIIGRKMACGEDTQGRAPHTAPGPQFDREEGREVNTLRGMTWSNTALGKGIDALLLTTDTPPQHTYLRSWSRPWRR